MKNGAIQLLMAWGGFRIENLEFEIAMSACGLLAMTL